MSELGQAHEPGEGRGERARWLDDSRNVTRIVYALGALCALMFLADSLYTKKAHFDVEELFGFYAVYGFVGSVGLVLAAKAMRPVLRRDEDYYERDRLRPEVRPEVRPEDSGPSEGNGA